MSLCQKEENTSPEDLFAPNCLRQKAEGKLCEPDSGRAAFLITDNALNRLLTGISTKKAGAYVPKTSKLIENHELEWRRKEACIERMHAEKVGIDETSLRTLERTLEQMRAECEGEYLEAETSLLNCYKSNMITPLKCRCLIQDYLKKIEEHRENIFHKSKQA